MAVVQVADVDAHEVVPCTTRGSCRPGVSPGGRRPPVSPPRPTIELVEALGMAGTEGGCTDRAKGKLAAAGKFASALAQHPESRGALK
ncbi:hypothetical protein [Streptomyces sp. SAS_276]|uniref:hypothetical protein n=1 Tax=Streptomyces sp. SAS_276 TaxID=3412745 RepID=UPI00403CA56E